MLIRRRNFLGAVAAGITIAPVLPLGAQAASPARLPIGDFMRNARLVDAFRRGVQVMRARPGSEPGSWFWQGAVHAYSEEIFGDALLRDPGVARVNARRYWNQCPHFRQSSADFLIWHRAYLYYFERHLRAAAGEPELAVPYWNYDEESQRGFPAMFAPQFLDAERRVSNPLYHRNREAAFVSGRYALTEAVCAGTAAREAPQFFSEPGVLGFGGDILPHNETRPGAVEQRPHSDLHVAVGGVVGSTNGAMADIPTAAFDPIFWVHHANIDRLWREWAAAPGKSWGPVPSDEWLDAQPWTFIDADGTPQSRSRRFWLEAQDADVRYAEATEDPGLKLPSRGVRAAASQERAAPQREAFRSGRAQSVIASRQSAVLATLPASPPPPGSAGIVAMAKSAAPRRAASRGRARTLTVRLSDISYTRLPASGFSVYLAPKGARLTETSPYFLGTLDLFGRVGGSSGEGRHPKGHGSQQDFDASHLADRVDEDTLEVRIVPYALLVASAGAVAQRADGIRIGAISLLIGD